MSWKQNDEYYEHQREMAAENGRTEWLAFSAAARVGACVKVADLNGIPVDELECLVDYLTAHIQDRERRSHDRQRLLDIDRPF
jgi:hypothetical protein